MATYTWKTAGDGFWNDIGNWTPSGAPGGGSGDDDVFITAISPTVPAYTVRYDDTSDSEQHPIIKNLVIGSNVTLAIQDFGKIEINNGVLDNQGTISLSAQNQTGASPMLSLIGAVTVEGGGTINGADNPFNEIFGVGGPITNVDNRITGAFDIYNANFVNLAQGLVDASATNTQSEFIQGTLANSGTIQASGKAGLLFNTETVTNLGGIIKALDGSHVDLKATTITGGALAATGTGYWQIVADSTATLDGSSPSIALQTGLFVQDSAVLVLKGTLINQGFIDLNSIGGLTALDVASPAVTLSGGGTIFLGDASNNVIVGAVSTNTLNNLNNKIVGAGEIGNVSLTNGAAGLIGASYANVGLILSTGHTIANNGVLAALGGRLTVEDAVSGTGSAFVTGEGTFRTASTFSQNVTFQGGGTFEFAKPYSGQISGFASRDSLDFDSVTAIGATVHWSQDTATAGTLSLRVGKTTVGSVHLNGVYQTSQFATEADGHGGTEINFRQNLAETGDLNNDAHSDLGWMNSNGQAAVWEMNGASIVTSSMLPPPGGTWQMVGVGDFNGNGMSDLLFEDASAHIDEWVMNGINVSSVVDLPTPDPSWHIRETADMNGDGKSDIVLQSDDGRVAVWDMNGTNLLDAAIVSNPGTAWHVRAAGDFNGDGTADILLQNDNGSLQNWNMNGSTFVSAVTLPQNPGPAWQVRGSGDFNGDGISDILFQNTDGSVAVWDMSSATTILNSAQVANPGTAWQVMGAGDFNGDGKSDVLFQNTTDGTAAMWFMNGTSIASIAVSADPGTAWHPVQ